MASAQQKVAFFLCLAFTIFGVLHTTVAPVSLPGGITKIEKQDLHKHRDLLQGLKQAVRLENARHPKPPFKFVYLPYTLEASSQVVQGTSYRASVKLAPSKCRNDFSETREGLEACGVDLVNPEVLQQQKCCEFEIWSRPWLPGKDRLLIQKAECTASSAAIATPPRHLSCTVKLYVNAQYNSLKG